jgi:hypothetical protein
MSIIDSVKSPEIVIALNGPNPVPYPESPDELSEEVKQRVELSLETAAAQEIELIATVGPSCLCHGFVCRTVHSR